MSGAPLPIDLPPGVVMTQSKLGAAGRYADCSWVRFWRGKPQKIGGYTLLTTSGQIVGIPRGSTAWSDSATRQLVAVGTHRKLYMISDADYVQNDITPWKSSIVAANPLTTSSGSNEIVVSYPSHGAVVEQYVDIENATPVGGLTLNGSWEIISIVNANAFKIRGPGNATSSATGGGATVTLGLQIEPGIANPASGFGWGAGTWGTGTWGTPRSVGSISFSPRQWSMGNFGKVLIACPSNRGLYSFNPSISPLQRAQIIPNAPTACSGVVVTSDNIVIALGSSLDPATGLDGGAAKQNLLQYWASAQGDYTNWDIAAVSGPSGSPSRAGTVREGTRIIAGGDIGGSHITLVWTDTALYEFQYTGSEFVFNVTPVGKECGLIGPQAYVVVGMQAFWMSPHGFKMFNGSVQNIPNYQDVSEWVISQLRPYFTVKTVAWYNQRYNEVWFGFVPINETEPKFYVAVNLDDWSWTKGEFQEGMSSATRFTGYDARPLVFGSNGSLYQFDNGLDANGAPQPWFLDTGGFELSNGARSLGVNGVAMDMQRQIGSITATITTYDRTPAQPVVLDQDSIAFGPSEEIADLRVAGRVATLRLSGGGALGDDFRMGVPKALFTTEGARR